MSRSAFYPGSFDPPTNGHLDVIARALRQFDRLVVGVGAHHGKSPLIELSARLALIDEVSAPVAREAGSTLDVVSFSGLVVDAAREHGATALIRGIRDGSDLDYEVRMAHMNHAMAGDVDTVFFAATPGVGFISSTLVKQIAGMGGDISAFVPPGSARAIAAALKK